MVKNMFFKSLFGFVWGIAIGSTIPMIISLIIADGSYYPVTSDLVKSCGSEISAVVVQYLLCGVLGFLSCFSSIIFKIENWSLLKRSITYYAVSAVIFFPVVYLAKWVNNIFDYAWYLLGFVIVYSVIWVIRHIVYKRKIKVMNDKIKNNNN